MRYLTLSAAGFLCLAFAHPAHTADEKAPPSFLFVQEASAATFDGTTLTLTDPKPAVTAFADRPNRIVEDVELTRFVTGWSKGADSFQDDPPNAALITEGAAPVIVELNKLRQSDDGLQYDVTVLSGDMQNKMDGITLVIDDNESMCAYIGC